MATITLNIPDETRKEMKKHSEIKWNEIARKAIIKRIEDLKTLDLLLEKSTLKKEDAEEIAQVIKERVWKMHKGKMGTL
jgi:cell division protein YceG involved in septum cleavage